MTFRQKSPRCANDKMLFFTRNTEFRKRRQVFADGARSDFHKRQRLAIVADEIDFALDASRSVIPGDEYVPVPPQIPVGISFSTNTGTPGFELPRVAGKTLVFTQATPRGPVHGLKHQL